jgi:hypothetical protein
LIANKYSGSALEGPAGRQRRRRLKPWVMRMAAQNRTFNAVVAGVSPARLTMMSSQKDPAFY